MSADLPTAGFYSVRLDGAEGVAYCQHHKGFDNDRYVTWAVMYLADAIVGPRWTQLDTDHGLEIGPRIEPFVSHTCPTKSGGER